MIEVRDLYWRAAPKPRRQMFSIPFTLITKSTPFPSGLNDRCIPRLGTRKRGEPPIAIHLGHRQKSPGYAGILSGEVDAGDLLAVW